MSTNFVVTAENNVDQYVDNVSKGDVVEYTFDFRPWQEDNEEIVSFTWTSESGEAGVASPVNNDGIASALITFNQSGGSLISVTAITATMKKKIWLRVKSKDLQWCPDDYGINDE